jgi:hypothetical protein
MKKITTQEIELTADDIVHMLKLWADDNLPDEVRSTVEITLDGINHSKRLLDDVGTIIVKLEYED